MFSDETTVVIVIRDPDHPEQRIDTHLGVLVTEEVVLLPFSSVANAVDCLRILIRRLQADQS